MDVKNDNKASTVEVKKDQFAERQDSIESALSELALSEEIETAKPGFDFVSSLHERKSSVSSISSEILSAATTASVPPSSPNIEHFYKEVQRYERIVNSLMTKTLNGTTPLDIKWKELHDMLEKDASKRTVNISRLFPEKNRSMLSVPYDHSRVLLPTETDNYINAAHIRVSILKTSLIVRPFSFSLPRLNVGIFDYSFSCMRSLLFFILNFYNAQSSIWM